MKGGGILDVGCGYGFLLECARRFGISAIGIEGSNHAIEYCRLKHPKTDIRYWEDGTDIPINDHEIGVAMVNQFIDHISMESIRHLFSELYRVLKDDGIVIVHSPSKYNNYDFDPGHISFFSPSEFSVFVRSYNFQIVKQFYFFQPILGRSRYSRLIMRALSEIIKPERLSASIDLVARKIPLTHK